MSPNVKIIFELKVFLKIYYTNSIAKRNEM